MVLSIASSCSALRPQDIYNREPAPQGPKIREKPEILTTCKKPWARCSGRGEPCGRGSEDQAWKGHEGREASIVVQMEEHPSKEISMCKDAEEGDPASDLGYHLLGCPQGLNPHLACLGKCRSLGFSLSDSILAQIAYSIRASFQDVNQAGLPLFSGSTPASGPLHCLEYYSARFPHDQLSPHFLCLLSRQVLHTAHMIPC
jgi:hypothetical protein